MPNLHRKKEPLTSSSPLSKRELPQNFTRQDNRESEIKKRELSKDEARGLQECRCRKR
jgi:hypothetical protein